MVWHQNSICGPAMTYISTILNNPWDHGLQEWVSQDKNCNNLMPGASSCNRTNKVHKNKWFPKYDAYWLSAYFLFSNLRIFGHDVKIRKQYSQFHSRNICINSSSILREWYTFMSIKSIDKQLLGLNTQWCFTLSSSSERPWCHITLRFSTEINYWLIVTEGNMNYSDD